MVRRLGFFIVVILLIFGVTADREGTADTGSEVGTKSAYATYGRVYPSYDGIRRIMNTSDISEDSQFGYIDEEGGLIAECKYDQATDFVNGIGVLKEGKVITAIDTKGKTILTFDSDFSDVKYYDGEKGIVRKDGLDYLVDKDGRLISAEGYDILFYDPYTLRSSILATKGDLYGFIDWSGNILTPVEYREIYGSQDSFGIMEAVNQKGKHGFITRNGKVLVPAIYDDAGEFKEGAGILYKGGKAAFVNASGKRFTSFVYNNAGNFSEGLANVMKGKKWGYIDKTGKEVIRAVYDHPADFQDGYANIQNADESFIEVENPLKKSRKINVYLDDRWLYLDREPVLENGTVLASMRETAEPLGYFVTWNSATETASLQNDEKILYLTVGSKQALVNFFDDGVPATTEVMDSPAELINGRVLVPVQFVAEQIGAEVIWEEETGTIQIKTAMGFSQ